MFEISGPCVCVCVNIYIHIHIFVYLLIYVLSDKYQTCALSHLIIAKQRVHGIPNSLHTCQSTEAYNPQKNMQLSREVHHTRVGRRYLLVSKSPRNITGGCIFAWRGQPLSKGDV